MSTVQVKIQAINTGFGQARLAFKGLQTSVGKLKSAVFNLKTAFAAAGIGVVLKKLVSESTKFEDALLDLQKVMSDTDGDAKQFTGTVNALSDKFGIAASEILQGAANFKQAGFTIKESFELQELALRTATISQLSVAESAALVVRALKGFKAPASEAARLIDIMNEVSNRYATSLKQLGIGMADVSPVAEKMGFSFEETSALLTTMIEVFQSGSEAATAFNFGLIRLISPATKVTDALKDLGVEQKEIVNGQLQMRKGKDIFFDVQKAFEGIAESEKLVFTQRLGGIRQTAKLSEIYDGLAKTTEITAVGMTSFGSSLKEMNIRLSAASTKLARTWQAFNNMARVLGDVLMPTILRAAASLKEFFRAMQEPEAIENFKRILSGAKKILDVVTTAVKILWIILAAFPIGVIDFFKNVSAEVDKTTESMSKLKEALEPPEKTSWQKFVKFISGAFWDILTESKVLGKSLGNIFGVFVGGFLVSIKRLATAFFRLGEVILNVFTLNFAGAKEAFGKFVTDLDGFNKQMAINWKVAMGNIKKDWEDMIAGFESSIPPDAPGPVPGRLFGPPQPPGRFDPDAPFIGPPTPEDTKEHTDKIVGIWRNAFDELDELSDEEIRSQAQKTKQYIQTIEESGKATGSNLGNIWHNARSKFEENIDLLDEKTLAWFNKMDERFPQLSNTAESSLTHIQNISRAVTDSMHQGFEGFFLKAMDGFENFADFATSMLDSIKKSIASVFAGMATKSITEAFPSFFGTTKHEGGLVMHKGGVVPVFHGGGILRPDERMIKAQTGEGVLSRKGMKAFDQLNNGNPGNTAAQQPEEQQITIINMIDPGSMVSIGLQDPRAKGIVINHISEDTIGRGITFKTLRRNL